jgi:hypothetical protein
MDMETAGEEDMYFVNMVATEQEGDDSDEDDASLEREYKAWSGRMKEGECLREELREYLG